MNNQEDGYIDRKTFLNKVISGANRFDLQPIEVKNYFMMIKDYIITNTDIQRNKIVEPLSERQEVCSENAIRCLFNGNFIQALHETYDVLSDFNKNTEKLTYNEYIVIKNILVVYEYLAKIKT